MSELSTSSYAIASVFVLGYFLIAIEHVTHISKSAVALLTAVICWTLFFVNGSANHETETLLLEGYLGSTSQVIFFLLGALAIVETISIHRGFKLLTDRIEVGSKRKMLWMLSLITFFLSSVIDNLTATLVMITLMRKMLPEGQDRLLIGGAIVIAANAGGAWTPIGDVTTTMLWIGGQISTFAILKDLFLPSIACLISALVTFSWMMSGNFVPNKEDHKEKHFEPFGRRMFFFGIAALLFVPAFKVMTGLPPYIGILLGLSVLWFITDWIHRNDRGRHHLKFSYVLNHIDMASILFFLGILLAVNALEAAKILDSVAVWLDQTLPHANVIAIVLGIISAVVDNVPLVAATMGMYNLNQFAQDSSFWELVAFCAGTGGSMLIIGSAAGVVFMALEKVSFFWYVKNVTLPAAVGYFTGIAVYLLQ